MKGEQLLSYKQNSSRLRRLPDFFGITDSSGLMPLSRIWDNGVINNGKLPTVAELEQQAKSGNPISLMDLADAVHREKKPSVMEKLRNPSPKGQSRKSTQKKSKEKEHTR